LNILLLLVAVRVELGLLVALLLVAAQAGLEPELV
jgi:hypothetical protein